MRIFGKMFNRQPSRGDAAFSEAVRANTELIARMREGSQSNDPIRALMADLWSQHHNIPFMTTVYEAVKEMKVATDHADDQRRQNSTGT